jgi:muramoyltetrapeptide carboxypeptidase
MNFPIKNIGIVAPGSPVEPTRFAKALAGLEREGFTIKVFGDACSHYGSKFGGFSSDSRPQRAAAILAAYGDDSVDAVLAAKGGYGSLELLPWLPIREMAQSNKPFIGFSDVTALLVAIVNEGGYAIHSPTLESGWGRSEPTEESNRSSAFAVELIKQFPAEHVCSATVVKGEKKSLRAPIVGGNLMVLASLCGTPWQVSTQGKMLFLEEVSERPYRIHRAITQLKLSGALNGCLGVLLGHFTGCTHEHGPDWLEAVVDALGGEVDVASGLCSGHEPLNMAIPFGLDSTIALE